jgi:tryptophan 2,3-dioxygenase
MSSHGGDEAPITYGTYLMLERLLELQVPRSQPVHPDELLFIVVHQASELWFKVMLHEIDQLISHMQAGDALAALNTLKRLNGLVAIVSQSLTALDTLPPQRFAEFRGYLGSSSGSQSNQFRAIEAASGLREAHFLHVLQEHGPIPPLVQAALDRPTLQALYLAMLDQAGATLEGVYRAKETTPLFLLAEELLEYEQGFAKWRFLHVQLVERIIGPMTGGTGGTLGAKYLSRTVAQRFFPELWAVRSKVYGPPAKA